MQIIHYFLSLISAENRRLISFLFVRSQSPLPGDFLKITTHTANDMSQLPYHIADTVIFSSFLQFSLHRNSNNNYIRQWRDELTLEKYDLARKETWREHVPPRVPENEQVKIPTRGHQSPEWPDTIALKKVTDLVPFRDS